MLRPRRRWDWFRFYTVRSSFLRYSPLLISFIFSFFASKSRARKVYFFENFSDFSPVENFFELSTSYQQCRFFDAVFLKICRRIGPFSPLLLTFAKTS